MSKILSLKLQASEESVPLRASTAESVLHLNGIYNRISGIMMGFLVCKNGPNITFGPASVRPNN